MIGQQAELEDDTDSDKDVVIVETTIVKSNKSYKVAKTHPRSLRSVPATSIISDHGATRFLEALQTFLCQHSSQIIPRSHDGFDLWKRIEFHLPAIAEAGIAKLKNVVCASPPVPAAGHRRGEPAHFEFRISVKNESR